MPSTSTDPVFGMHRSLLHLSFLYVDLREAIRWECGEHIGTGNGGYHVLLQLDVLIIPQKLFI